jgi:hypothetical protein
MSWKFSYSQYKQKEREELKLLESGPSSQTLEEVLKRKNIRVVKKRKKGS